MRSTLHFTTSSVPTRTTAEYSRPLAALSQRRVQAHGQQYWANCRQQGAAFRPVTVAAEAGATTGAPAGTTEEEKFIEVVLEKPLGLKFARGNDGCAYVVQNNPDIGNTDESIEIGDKIVEVSASFGEEVWEARNFGQVIYAIRTRNGGVYLKIQRNFGDLSALQEEELTEAEILWRKEQAGGNYGAGTREVQLQNYEDRQKNEKERTDLFTTALNKFKSGKVEEALIDFENVISMEPSKYMSDAFSRVSDVCMYSNYNAACCYAALGKTDAGLESLENALAAGFDDYRKVRNDPNLEELRKSEEFTTLINKYDEPIINENAVRALKGLFSFGKKNDDE